MKQRKQRGVAAVELALIIVPLLIATFGITELGRALYQYNALVKASRDAVRYLALQDLANLSTGERATVYNTTRSLAVCGAEVCTDATPALASGLVTTQVSLCDYLTCAPTHKGVLTGAGSVDLVTVTIGGTGSQAFNFTSLVPFVIPSMAFSPIKTTMASRYF